MVTDESLRTTKNATAAMSTVLVSVLEQSMPGIEAAFLERLGQAFAENEKRFRRSQRDRTNALDAVAPDRL